MTYGESIKKARKQSGLTQAELAKKCGLAAITIQQYERNLREPSLATLGKIAKVLDTTVYEMIGPDWSGIDMGDAFAPEAKKEPAPISESGSNKARLLAILNQLSDTNQAQLLSYAEFLKDSERK